MALKAQGGRMVPRSGPLMVASSRAQELKSMVLKLNPMLEQIARPSARIVATSSLMQIQREAGQFVRRVLAAWQRSESLEDVGPMVEALEFAPAILRRWISPLENNNYNSQAEFLYLLADEIESFVAGVKSGRIA